jgi:oligoribonuclease
MCDRLIWLDMEMSGLDVDKERILEIAVVITDAELQILGTCGPIAVFQPNYILTGMVEWCQKTHSASGLIDRVRYSEYSEPEVELELLQFLKDQVPPQTSPLCGNSVYFDRLFLRRYMPFLEGYCHYRNLDVSTLKELARRWAPQVYEGVIKQETHTAMQDILESIEELRWYRRTFLNTSFKSPEVVPRKPPKKGDPPETEVQSLARRLEEYMEFAQKTGRFSDLAFYEKLLTHIDPAKET